MCPPLVGVVEATVAVNAAGYRPALDGMKVTWVTVKLVGAVTFRTAW